MEYELAQELYEERKRLMVYKLKHRILKLDKLINDWFCLGYGK